MIAVPILDLDRDATTIILQLVCHLLVSILLASSYFIDKLIPTYFFFLWVCLILPDLSLFGLVHSHCEANSAALTYPFREYLNVSIVHLYQTLANSKTLANTFYVNIWSPF